MLSQVLYNVFRVGKRGLVPAPTSSQVLSQYLLCADGVWRQQALRYLGGVAGASIPLATSVNAGDLYYITTTGGAFTAGKYAISNGTVWTQVDSISGYLPKASQPTVDAGSVVNEFVGPDTLHGYVDPKFAVARQSTATRAVAPYLLGDGSGSDYAYAPTGAAGNIDTGDFTALWKFRAPSPDETPAVGWLGIGLFSSIRHSYGTNVVRTMIVRGGDDGELQFVLGASGAGRTLKFSKFISKFGAGNWVTLCLRRSAGVMSAYCNGTELTLTPGTSGIPSSDWDERIDFSYITSGSIANGIGAVKARYFPVVINTTLTPAEILTHAQTGLLPDWCAGKTGSAVPAIDLDGSSLGNFSSSTGGGDTPAAIDADSTVSGKIYMLTSVGGNSWTVDLASIPAVGLQTGIRMGIRLKARLASGIARQNFFGSNPTDNSFLFTPTATETLFEGTFVLNSGTLIRLGVVSSNGSAYEYDDIEVWPLGPIATHELDPNFGLRDLGTNGLHGVRTDVVSYVGPKIDSSTAFKVTHSGSGNMQFADGTAIETAKGWVIESLIVKSTAVVTWSLGNVASGKQHVADFSLVVGDNYIPAASLVARNITTANLWSISSDAADITIYPVMRRTN